MRAVSRRDCLSPPPEGTRDRAAYDRFRAYLEEAGPAPAFCPAQSSEWPRYRCHLAPGHRPGHVAYAHRTAPDGALIVLAVWFDR
jgi:glyoxylase-like metal-dependent hydrolase (beta-lactamase superfamily II)